MHPTRKLSPWGRRYCLLRLQLDALVSVPEKDYGWRNGILNHPSEQDLLHNWTQILFENNKGIRATMRPTRCTTIVQARVNEMLS